MPNSQPGSHVTIHLTNGVPESRTLSVFTPPVVTNPGPAPATTTGMVPQQAATSFDTNCQWPGPSRSELVVDPTLISCDPRSEKWSQLTAKYGHAKLDAHEWEWRGDDWLPVYRYQPINVITDLWIEHVDGLNGHLSMRELKDRWGAKWRRNEGGLKTEGGRCAKVIALIEQLALRVNWDVPLALRFLKEKYETPYLNKVRAFCDYLQKDKGAGFQAVLDAANNYP
jgi:hypothetical protein